MSIGRTTLLLVSVFAFLKLLSFSWESAHKSHGSSLLVKRTELASSLSERECDNVYQYDDQCAYVMQHCSDAVPGLINYIQIYFCASPIGRSFLFVIFCAWLLFLFGFVGIAASDFFCPNLQTIATALHLSESLTGVTFLALGNGSPDLFSTFSAMQSNMGSLALGELIGAAAFIVSVVAGCMCANKPFRAKKFGFLRDVSFFTLAIVLVMIIVADGLIHLYESILLIVFYLVYVSTVVAGNYYMKRRSAYQNLVQRARLEYEETGNDIDDLILRGHAFEGSKDEMELYDEGFEVEGYQSDYRQHRNPLHPKLRIRTSLFSAIEFQDVVHSLQNAIPGYHHIRNIRRRRESMLRGARRASNTVPLTQRQPAETSNADDPDAVSPDSPGLSPTPTNELQNELTPRQRFYQDVRRHLFPSLWNFRRKPLFSKISSLISAPVLFLLVITLPVVKEDALESKNGIQLDDDALAMLEDPVEEETGAMAFGDADEELPSWCRWLTATHLLCSPIFVAVVLSMTGIARPVIILPIVVAVSGLTSAAFLFTTSDHMRPRLYWMMCFVGFVIAVVWIYVIANEVVGVLQVIGMAIGVSDAILGLTVFAMGNSLGDFVANVTMAKLGFPLMAMSACFGGPMLNIMLGVGLGATYVTLQREEPYAIEVSSTILVSAIGLLIVLVSSLILVPLNGFRMSRKFGYAWIGIYLICTVINLYLEISH
ncbi:Sodium/calcium exchanger protein-domain-containing protein [Radiomyces spectabilis]|uniref:Sodium/calcium exchanger protein-domain-containing protein n=1 Tax=Radiomyces spectabilis TaxID=64574 RepID=UPI00221E700A|nr:Sodium/calcium exchanger protein-domain-containing protein [Radiomyces spectabilis]KAI8393739.1 Sodium/calcium exchanger protein-domain-containing protein [Radiomyces spectabilis]